MLTHESPIADPKIAISVENLDFAYGKATILHNVSFSIETGKITTLLGPNGCGKSTLFNLMTKNLQTHKGKILLKGVDIRQIPMKNFAKKVAIVQQNNTVNEDIRVKQLVYFGRTPYRKAMGISSDKDEETVEWAMRETGVIDFCEREMGHLSGGQRQRVWIAMALAQNTKILLLDEPTTYLDIRYQIDILELIQRLNREYGLTVVMVLHDINQAMHYSDSVLGLKGGHLIIEGKPEEAITQESLHQLYDIALQVVDINDQKIVLLV